MKKTVLITGCSSGFGKLAAKTFYKDGWNVVATMRSPEKEKELTSFDGMVVAKLDLQDKKNVNEAIQMAIDTFGSIDVLVNNAGYGGLAIFEQFSEEQIYDMFETNVFGTMRVTREVLAHMRQKGSGVVINITSMAGIMGLSLASTYSASKFALEGWSEALALEYKPLGIHIKTIAPGGYGTSFNDSRKDNLANGDEQLKTHAIRLSEHLDQVQEQMKAQNGEANPQDVADLIYECATAETPVHNVSGKDAEMLMNMKSAGSQQDFIDQLSQMLIPN